MLGRARGATPPRALGWSKSRQPHGVGRARGATPPCVRGSSENRQRRGVGSRFLLFLVSNSDVITRPRRSARSGPGHCFRRHRPAGSPVSISFFRKGRGRAEPSSWATSVGASPSQPARFQLSARVRLPAQRFVPDAPLEGGGFELPVLGRIYSAAMRSQVISRCSSLSPVRRGGGMRTMRSPSKRTART